MRVVLLIFLLASCSSAERSQKIAECGVGTDELAEGVTVAHKVVEDADGKYLEKYRFSIDYGKTCGFWFEASLKPGLRGGLLAGPTEVILSKEKWKYVDTKYYSHELPVK